MRLLPSLLILFRLPFPVSFLSLSFALSSLFPALSFRRSSRGLEEGRKSDGRKSRHREHGISTLKLINVVLVEFIFRSATVWGSSAKHSRGQKVGLDHVLEDEDVVQLVKK